MSNDTALDALDAVREELEVMTLPVVQEGKFQDLVRDVVSLVPEDLQALRLAGPVRSQDGIQHLRAFHHVVALKLALGEKPIQICRTLSITPQTISKLEKDPQFCALVESYRGEVVSKAVDTFELMELVTVESLTALHERLTGEERGAIPIEALRRVGETFSDRTGHSPIRRSETLARHTHELTSSTLQRIKALHKEDSAYKAEAIEAEIISSHEAESKNNGAGGSIADAFGAVGEAKAARKESRGEGV